MSLVTSLKLLTWQQQRLRSSVGCTTLRFRVCYVVEYLLKEFFSPLPRLFPSINDCDADAHEADKKAKENNGDDDILSRSCDSCDALVVMHT